jgi:hypothetical protein
MASLFTAEGLRSTKRERVEACRRAREKELEELSTSRVVELPVDEEETADSAPSSYTGNSNKEELCLQYVDNFREEFTRLYPGRPQQHLYLSAPNEYGVEKFVCTTLRPTRIPYESLYNVKDCVDFICHHLHYEPLEDPTRPPACLPSPTAVLEWAVGDSFDFAVLLCSLLLGAGYDAYVCYGTAPENITMCDQTSEPCPAAYMQLTGAQGFAASSSTKKTKRGTADRGDQEEKEGGLLRRGEREEKQGEEQEEEHAKKDGEEQHGGPSVRAPYCIAPRGPPESRYLAELAAAAVSEEAFVKNKSGREWKWDSEEEEKGDDDVEDGHVHEEKVERDGMDPLRGRRMHAWVQVLGGKRQLEGVLSIDPVSGRIYTSRESPFLSVQAAFNASNFWVNMQGEDRAAASLHYDFSDAALWEYVIISTDEGRGDELPLEGSEEDTATSTIRGAGGGPSEILDLPPSWVSKLRLPQSRVSIRYPPDGLRTIYFRRSKLELLAANLHAEGLTVRLTLYRDLKRTVVQEVREVFENRQDRLARRIRCPRRRLMKEYFLPGRPAALKHSYDCLGMLREQSFYVEARLDGLKCRSEEIGKKIVEHYEGRPDHLIYRSINVMSQEQAAASGIPQLYMLPTKDAEEPEVAIYKMSEKYARDATRPANQDPSKRTFYVQEGRIRTLFHYAPGAVTCLCINHRKESRGGSVDARGSLRADGSLSLEGGSGGSLGVGEGELAPPCTPTETLQEAIAAEKECFTQSRHLHLEMIDMDAARLGEERASQIALPIFELARRTGRQVGSVSDPSAGDNPDGSATGEGAQLDYLTPFLQHVPDPRSMTQEEAQKARDSCLKALKERLLERANIINTRLNDENTALAKRQAAFQRSQRDNDAAAEEEFERFCSESMFRIQILEQRLIQHEETALQKYADIDARLSKDPRLAVLRERGG